ncbi:MAG: sulfurtransferase-like selenium metabolism protein YedF [Polyangia bacterium]|jgi:selenium metabolism protein YedF|nr:sulfurtransferase-like selenium metabolism protein YedF [Polyangia bacterium]
MTDTKTLDCRGLSCPLPVLKTREALAGAAETIVVVVDNEAAAANVTRFAESQGASVSLGRSGGDFTLTIQPGAGAGPGGGAGLVCGPGVKKNLVVYVASEGMGIGDEGLGRTLMAAFLDTMAQWTGELSHVIFVNGGAKLAVKGSPVLDQIRQLEEMGATVLVCGTCLRHFGIQDELAVGSLSNMFAILEVLTSAGRIIRP